MPNAGDCAPSGLSAASAETSHLGGARQAGTHRRVFDSILERGRPDLAVLPSDLFGGEAPICIRHLRFVSDCFVVAPHGAPARCHPRSSSLEVNSDSPAPFCAPLPAPRAAAGRKETAGTSRVDGRSLDRTTRSPGSLHCHRYQSRLRTSSCGIFGFPEILQETPGTSSSSPFLYLTSLRDLLGGAGLRSREASTSGVIMVEISGNVAGGGARVTSCISALRTRKHSPWRSGRRMTTWMHDYFLRPYGGYTQRRLYRNQFATATWESRHT